METTATQLALESGYSVSTIVRLAKLGFLPDARWEGREVYLPRLESLIILNAHTPGEHWVKGRARPGKRKHQPAKLSNDTAKLPLEHMPVDWSAHL
jgi:hypothetical protein